MVPAMLHGALTMLVTGVALVGLREAQGADLNHVKIGIKLAVLVVILALVYVKRDDEHVGSASSARSAASPSSISSSPRSGRDARRAAAIGEGRGRSGRADRPVDGQVGHRFLADRRTGPRRVDHRAAPGVNADAAAVAGENTRSPRSSSAGDAPAAPRLLAAARAGRPPPPARAACASPGQS